MASVRLSAIEKVYAGGHRALCGLDLTIADGELVVLVGPSGSGKSTALRIIAGLELPSAGRILFDADDVTGWSPRERNVAMVFQSYALYPHKSVRDNLAFGLRMRGTPGAEIARRTGEIAERLTLTDLLDRKPAQLSGGQRQRVALGRALVRDPRAFLLDEPLSNLDAKLRVEMRAEIGRLHAVFGVTMIHVTHDQEEAMTLGDRVAVLGASGRLEQCAPPLEIYRAPQNAFVAEFIGLPRINWFDGEVRGTDFTCADFALALPGPPRMPCAARLGVRPHDLALADASAALLRGRAEWIEALGPTQVVHARSEHGVAYRVVVPAEAEVRRGEVLGTQPNAARALLFDPQTGARL